MCEERRRRRSGPRTILRDAPVDLDEIMGPTRLNPASGTARYSFSELRLQGPWWVRFGRWLRGEPQPTLRGRG